MANALPIALLAGGALLLASGKKKRRRKKAAPAYEWQEVPPTKPPAAAAKTSGPSGKAASSAVWKSRQTALAFVAGMKICNSHPGTVDGVYGPATLNAIIAFQVCAGIDVDGKWGSQTDAAMKKMLVDIAGGQVKLSKPPKASEALKPPKKEEPSPSEKSFTQEQIDQFRHAVEQSCIFIGQNCEHPERHQLTEIFTYRDFTVYIGRFDGVTWMFAAYWEPSSLWEQINRWQTSYAISGSNDEGSRSNARSKAVASIDRVWQEEWGG